jgi:hypothetical protein
MLLWVSLLVGLALMASAVVLVFRMRGAERRARRALYRALSIDDGMIDTLLKRGGDASSHLAAIRGPSEAVTDPAEPTAAAEPGDEAAAQTAASARGSAT